MTEDSSDWKLLPDQHFCPGEVMTLMTGRALQVTHTVPVGTGGFARRLMQQEFQGRHFTG